MYSLKYEMIIQMVRQFGYSGEIHAYVSPQARLKSGGWAILVLLNGIVTSHVILDKNRQKLFHDNAARSVISQLGVLEWRLVNSVTAPTASETAVSTKPAQTPMPAEKMISFYPQHQPVSYAQMQQWSRMQRHVYALADGTRSAEQIAKLLLCSPITIEQIIHDLQISGAIRR